MSMEDKCVEWGISPVLLENLQELGYERFFSIQEDVIPVLIRQNSNPVVIPRDIYVSSPTGSGKTLCYALPIANYLLENNFTAVHRLRCLIVLPSRELAMQVSSFFKSLVKGTDIVVSMTIGTGESEEEYTAQYGMFPGFPSWHDRHTSSVTPSYSLLREYDWDYRPDQRLDRGLSTDILITTTGKLMDNLLLTPGFTLKHLRFLILDEADRLLSTGYHGWVRSLLSSVDSIRESDSTGQRIVPEDFIDESFPLQRLLFSATATDDPKALALLGISHPIFIYNREAGAVKTSDEPQTVIEREVYVLPRTLLERRMTVTTENKLFQLLVLLLAAFNPRLVPDAADRPGQDYAGVCAAPGAVCIIFVSSVDASHRLSTLLELVNGQREDAGVRAVYQRVLGNQLGTERPFPGTVEEMTRLVRPAERERVLEGATRGDVSIIVSSDRMARGMDVSQVQLVVNYEVPKQATTYVHRAGRTARAGRTGRCLTLVKEGQYKTFQKLSAEIQRSNDGATQETATENVRVMPAYHLPTELEAAIQPLYDEAIAKLPDFLA